MTQAAALDFDHVELLIGTVENAADANAKAVRNTVLSPRFYTTDFDAMDKLNIESVRAEWDIMMKEYEGDNNHDHFQRDAAFADEVRELMPQLSPEMRQEFLDFLISSLTSEFSGCILYNEVRKHVKNPDIKQLMTFMARDESRHAGFKPKFIFYATYLSEKIGYARYITIYRQLEKHPDKRFHPIFRWFERWCNDEFRHGESFALIMRANPDLLRGVNLLWIRFFILAVYATMYVRDHTRPLLHEAMGFESTNYDYEVFRITSDIARQVFPIEVDIDHPTFRACMTRLVELSIANAKAKERGGLIGLAGRAITAVQAAYTFGKLYLLPVKKNDLPADIRMQPTW
jgi:magnesium-protoporphyrin IX monomethyl ester (oxidative) cyclase